MFPLQNTMLLISVSTRRAHSKRACFNESRMFDVIHYITVTISVTISITFFSGPGSGTYFVSISGLLARFVSILKPNVVGLLTRL